MSVPHTNGGTAETLPAASDVIRTTSVAIKRPTGHSHTTSVSSSTSLLSPSASIFSAGASSSIASSSTADTTLYGSGTDESLNVSGDYVLAMHDYDAEKQNATCLSFRAGQVIRVYNRDVSGWWDGELEGRRGWFPSNYVGEDITAVADEVSPSKVVCTHLKAFDIQAKRCP
jgi:son of sevenless-like protein